MDKQFDTPLMRILHRFTAPGVPERGPEEEPIPQPNWRVAEQPADLHFPGRGIAEHPMLYIGEGCNRMFLVNEGKVIWSYDTGSGWEYDDIWMKKNGNIVFSRMYWAGEVTPDKRLIWRYNAKWGEELHTIQPIDSERVLMVVSGHTPYAVIVNTVTGQTEYRHNVPFEKPGNPHGQFRRFRMTGKNTFLVPYMRLNQVVEYDMDFKPLWEYAIDKPWAAIRLNNGNTLITNEKHILTREVSPDGRTVWEMAMNELPAEYRLHDCQSCVRLKNGNTIFCSRGNDGLSPQLVEVTREKEVVWVLNDWRELGPCTAIQVLDDPGDPEIPGECER